MKNAIPFIKDKVTNGLFVEAYWVTGKHHADPSCRVGMYVTLGCFSDWTDHPENSATGTTYAPDHVSPLDWILSCLPEKDECSGTITILHRKNAFQLPE